MTPLRDQRACDISLWLSGESVDAAADRAIDGLARDAEARRMAAAAVAIEDLVRDWYGGIPLPPPAPHVVERRQRRSLVKAAASAVAAGLIAASLFGGDSFGRVIGAASAWTASVPRPALATESWWQLRRSGTGFFGR